MPELKIELSDVLAARLNQAAAAQGKSAGELVQEHLADWLAPRPVTEDRGLWKAFVTLRMRGLAMEDAAEQLQRETADLEAWDRQIREDPKRWNEAYFQIRKATDPLAWEMKVRDKFIDLWGEKPD